MVIILIISLLILLEELIRFLVLRNKYQKRLFSKDKIEKEFQYLSILTTSAIRDNTQILEFFPKHLNLLKEMVNWTYHSMFRLDEETQLLTIRFTGYLPEWYMSVLAGKVLIKVGDASVGRAVATKQPTTINSANTDPRFKSVTPIAGQTGYKSLSCYPLLGKLKTHGGFCTYSAYENIFSLSDIQFLSTCANFFGAILDYKLLRNAKDIKKTT